MRHVDEGDLHAWLDGALDQLGDGRAAEVREHLRSCASCREALVAEETLRARADQVLTLAVPRSIDAPPFETLVERAHALQPPVAPAARSRLSRVTWMGWAASVVVALGAGWTARTLEMSPDAEMRVATVPVAEVRQPVIATAAKQEIASSDAAAGPEPQRVADREGVSSYGSRGTSRPVREEAAAPPLIGSVAESLAAPEAQAAAVEAPSAAPPTAPAPAAPQVATEQRPVAPATNAVASPRAARPTVLVSRRPRPGESAALAAAPRRSGLGIQRGADTTSVRGLFALGGVRGTGASKVALSTDADIDEAVDLIVPELPVLRVEWTEVSPGRPGLRVLQRLSPADTLEVRFVRSGGAAADAAADPLEAGVGVPLRAGWSQVVRVHRDGWLVARAPMKVEELEDLVDRAGSTAR